MKRKTIFILALALTLCFVLGFSACGDQHEHIEQIIPAIDPTCEAEGLTEGVECSECGEILTPQKKIEAKGHKMVDGECEDCLFSETFEFVLSSDETYYSIAGIGNHSDNKNVVIPSTFKNLPVKAIESNAFADITSITSITIPESITYIGDSAFRNCTALTQINFNATEMDDLSHGNKVFYDAGMDGDGIKVIIGSNVTKIPDNLFYPNYSKTSNITSVTFAHNSVCENIGNSAFAMCDQIKSITIPNSVTVIEEDAFFCCSFLEELTIGEGVVSIEAGAFCGCNELSKVDFNAIKMDDVETRVFGSDKDGIDLTIGKKVTRIPAIIFGAEGLLSTSPIKSITFEENSVCESIGSAAFSYCTALTSVTIPNSVKTIESDAFWACLSLTSVTIGSGVEYISERAFSMCNKIVEVYNLSRVDIENIDLGKNAKVVHNFLGEKSILETVGDYIFMNCENKYYLVGYIGDKTEISLPENYHGNQYGIYNYAFYSRKDITKVIIPNGVTFIEESAFGWCSSLSNVSVGDNVTFVGDDSFSYCESLKYNEYDNAYYLGNDENPYVILIKAKSKYISSCDINEKTKIIYQSAFDECAYITNIEISNSIKQIGEYAFSRCSSLAKIAIPDSVTTIGDRAFWNCTTLERVTIGENVQKIGDSAFDNCTSLNEIYYNPKRIDDFNDGIFDNMGENENELVITIGKNVTKIPNYLFCNQNNTASDSFPKISVVFEEGSVCETIGEYAFYECRNLTNINIPDSVTKIEEHAFYGCNSLESITIGKGVTYIGESVFYGCYSLVEVYINDIESWCNITFVEGRSNPLHTETSKEVKLYLNNEMVTNLVIPDTITTIKSYAFADYTFIENIELPNITIIEESAFRTCRSLASITLSEKLISIGDSAFHGCTSLANVQLPESLTTIDNSAFAYCGSLTSIEIPKSVTSIGGWAFFSCPLLENVTIDDGVTYIGEKAFLDCASLKSIEVNENNTAYKSVDGNLYTKDGTVLICYAIGKEDTSFAIPEGVTTVESYGFYRCKSLVSVTLPDSVKYIRSCAFRECSGLSSALLSDGVCLIDSYAFLGCYALESIIIPENITLIENDAFLGCLFINIYCEATSKPSGWNSEWNSANRSVYWYSEEEPTAQGEYWHYVDGIATIWE